MFYFVFVLYSVRSAKIVHFLIRISGGIGRRKELKRFTIKEMPYIASALTSTCEGVITKKILWLKYQL